MFRKNRTTTRMPGWTTDWSAPARTVADGGGLITGQTGFVAGTHVASNLGWRRVETLRAGDVVLTFDHGMQTVRDIQHDVLYRRGSLLPLAQKPILLPKGALNNRQELWLMPDQGLLVESEIAGDILGDPFVVVPARALTGFRSITAAKPDDELPIVVLGFDTDEAVYVEGGLLAYCPYPRDILNDATVDSAQSYKLLPLKAARHLVRCLIDDDDASGLLCDEDEIALISGSDGEEEHPQT